MIFVLTGPVHSGKTSLLKKVVGELKSRGVRADGFLSLAVHNGKDLAGYDLFDLKTGKAIPYLRKEGKKNWPKVGPFFFIPRALARAKKKILCCAQPDFLIVDEVGPLEVCGGGIWPALSAALRNPSRRYLLVVRQSILRDVLDLISHNRTEIINIKRDKNGSALVERILSSALEKKT